MEERARQFCADKEKSLHVLESEQSNPPYILGNFPRMELIFMCEEMKSTAKQANATDRLAQLSELKKLLDSGALTEAEFDLEKKRILLDR